MSATRIRDLVIQAQQDPTTEKIEAMWRAVFLLRAWYFMPASDVEGPAYPTVTLVDGRPWLLAFTNVRRLEEFAVSVDRVAEDGSVPLLVLDPAESMGRILDVADEIDGVIFDLASPATFRAPVEALKAYAHHFEVPIDRQ